MRMYRSLATGIVAAALAGVGASLSAGQAAAIAVGPVPGGVQVDLSHGETAYVSTSTIPAAVASLPSPAAVSFGAVLQGASQAASTLPEGRVSFTVLGPLDSPSGTMDVHEF